MWTVILITLAIWLVTSVIVAVVLCTPRGPTKPS